MKAALSIVLAGLLVTTPLKLVLAQAQQAADTTLLIGVSEVTPESALLWRPLTENRPLPQSHGLSLYDMDVAADPSGIPTLVILLGLAMGFALLLYAVYQYYAGPEALTLRSGCDLDSDPVVCTSDDQAPSHRFEVFPGRNK